MHEAQYVKIIVLGAILTMCISSTIAASNSSKTTQILVKPFSPQVSGFNSTNLTSGPVVLVDTRTLFIADLNYNGSGSTIEFWVGKGSPYGNQKQMVQTNNVVSPVNLYVVLPENLTLSSVDFLEAKSGNSSLDYVIFENASKKGLKLYDESNSDETIFRIPKCCLSNQYLSEVNKTCDTADEPLSLDLSIFESNETGLDPDITLNLSENRVIPYYQNLKCKENEIKLMVGDEIHGLIYNSSLIIQGTGILSHREYCTDVILKENGSWDTTTLYCYYVPPVASDPNFYLPVLFISAICFLLSAIAYGVILWKKDFKDVHTKCFIIFSSSMCLTFLSLIVMQMQSNENTCKVFGFFFVLAVTFSFLWFLIVGLEFVYLASFPIERDRHDKRLLWYWAASSGLSVLILAISLFSGERWVPDVPNSFVMDYGSSKCTFETPLDRAFIVFTPMILSIVGIITSLSIAAYTRGNDTRTPDPHDWLVPDATFAFVCRTFIMVIIVACFWLLNIIFYSHQVEIGKTQLALDVIKASLGIVTFIAFVLNKYAYSKLRRKSGNSSKKKKITSTQGHLELETPENSLELEQPLVTRSRNNSTQLHNNR